MTSTKIEKKMYTGAVTSMGGRSGQVTAANGDLDLHLAMPKEMDGPGGPGANPEQLFGAAYAACYESALRAHAKSKSLDPGTLAVTAHVTLGKTSGGEFQLGVVLEADMPGIKDHAQAMELMESAHKTCPYSRATRGNVEVELRLS